MLWLEQRTKQGGRMPREDSKCPCLVWLVWLGGRTSAVLYLELIPLLRLQGRTWPKKWTEQGRLLQGVGPLLYIIIIIKIILRQGKVSTIGIIINNLPFLSILSQEMFPLLSSYWSPKYQVSLSPIVRQIKSKRSRPAAFHC